jgi:hypothetical protein
LAPLVMGTIGQQQGSRGLDASSITNLLNSQKDNIAAAIPSGFGRLLGGTGLLDSLIPNTESPAADPNPEYLLIELASAVWSRSPRSDANMFDPRSVTDVAPALPSMLANLSSVPISCFAVSAIFCGPPGFAAAPTNAANSAGTPAPTAVDVSLRSRPSALAIRPIMSGVRNFMTSDTRFVAIAVYSRVRD